MQPQNLGSKDVVVGQAYPDAYYETMKQNAVKAREAHINKQKLVDIFDPLEELHAAHDEQLMKELQQSMNQVTNAGPRAYHPDEDYQVVMESNNSRQ